VFTAGTCDCIKVIVEGYHDRNVAVCLLPVSVSMLNNIYMITL